MRPLNKTFHWNMDEINLHIYKRLPAYKDHSYHSKMVLIFRFQCNATSMTNVMWYSLQHSNKQVIENYVHRHIHIPTREDDHD